MSVVFTFGEPTKDLGNINGPHPILVLEGSFLRTDDGLILAELVEDQHGRQYWKPFHDDKCLLQREIRLYGMGRT